MGLAEDIAGKVKGKASSETETAEESAELKEGDCGKRILAAISAKDAVALEAAIRDLNS